MDGGKPPLLSREGEMSVKTMRIDDAPVNTGGNLASDREKIFAWSTNKTVSGTSMSISTSSIPVPA